MLLPDVKQVGEHLDAACQQLEQARLLLMEVTTTVQLGREVRASMTRMTNLKRRLGMAAKAAAAVDSEKVPVGAQLTEKGELM